MSAPIAKEPKMLVFVFEDDDLEHTVLSAKAMRQKKNRMLIRTEQQTAMIDAVEG